VDQRVDAENMRIEVSQGVPREEKDRLRKENESSRKSEKDNLTKNRDENLKTLYGQAKKQFNTGDEKKTPAPSGKMLTPDELSRIKD